MRENISTKLVESVKQGTLKSRTEIDFVCTGAGQGVCLCMSLDRMSGTSASLMPHVLNKRHIVHLWSCCQVTSNLIIKDL